MVFYFYFFTRTLPKSESSSPRSNTPNTNFQQKLEGIDNNSKPTPVYKKRSAPKPLSPEKPKLESKHSFGKKRQAPQPQPALPKPPSYNNTEINQNVSGFGKPKMNPVKEMELMAKNKTTEVSILIFL